MITENQLKSPYYAVKSLEGAGVYFHTRLESSYFFNNKEEKKQWEESGAFEKAMKSDTYAKYVINSVFYSYYRGHMNFEEFKQELEKLSQSAKGIQYQQFIDNFEHRSDFPHNYSMSKIDPSRIVDALRHLSDQYLEGKRLSSRVSNYLVRWISDQYIYTFLSPQEKEEQTKALAKVGVQLLDERLFNQEKDLKFFISFARILRESRLDLNEKQTKNLLDHAKNMDLNGFKEYNFLNDERETLHPLYLSLIEKSPFPFLNEKDVYSYDNIHFASYSDKYWGDPQFVSKMIKANSCFFLKESKLSYTRNSSGDSFVSSFLKPNVDGKGNYVYNINRIFYLLQLVDASKAHHKASLVQKFINQITAGNPHGAFEREKFLLKMNDLNYEVKENASPSHKDFSNSVLHWLMLNIEQVDARFGNQSSGLTLRSPPKHWFERYVEEQTDFTLFLDMCKASPRCKFSSYITTLYMENKGNAEFKEFFEAKGYWFVSQGLSKLPLAKHTEFDISRFAENSCDKKDMFKAMVLHGWIENPVVENLKLTQDEMKEIVEDFVNNKGIGGENISWFNKVNAADVAILLVNQYVPESRSAQIELVIDWLEELTTKTEGTYVSQAQKMFHTLDDWMYESVSGEEGKEVFERLMKVKKKLKTIQIPKVEKMLNDFSLRETILRSVKDIDQGVLLKKSRLSNVERF